MVKGQGGPSGRCEVTRQDRGQITQDFPGVARSWDSVLSGRDGNRVDAKEGRDQVLLSALENWW